MKSLIGFISLILCSLSSNAKQFMTKIDHINASRFNIEVNNQYLNALKEKNLDLYVTHDELDHVLDLTIYENSAFMEPKIDHGPGGD